MREYTALQSITHLPFADVILSGQFRAPASDSNDTLPYVVPPKLMGYLEETHNDSQLQAVKVFFSLSTLSTLFINACVFILMLQFIVQAGLTRSPVILIQVLPLMG